jgi:hypothetical protein
MIQDDDFLFYWSIAVHQREFRISVRHDGSIEWIEDRALADAGGQQHLQDFVGALFGDQRAASRARHRLREFQIETPPDETAMALLRLAGGQDDGSEEDDRPWPDGLGDALDSFFFEQFWEHVNPVLPNPIPHEN